ncbi:integral membrane protein GPR180-like [Liolophura sinensis]|uniref:integral membrane protein GPR180-like n=1 Tax=Liolophura sinensis TaxID=3198878 RepID=UPI003158B643
MLIRTDSTWQILSLAILSSMSPSFAKTIQGTFTTALAQASFGQYLTSFCFHGETAEIRYILNTTGQTPPKIYLFLHEDWPEAAEAKTCEDKLERARVVFELVNVTGKYVVSHFKYPRIWHVLYADGYTCSPGRPVTPVEQPNYIQYDLQLVNPDSLGNPTEHFSDEETGLLRFYQLLTVAYFVLSCIFGPQIWQAMSKHGPMQLVLQLLTASMGLQAVLAFFMMVHLHRYARDGMGYPSYELMAEFFDVLSQFAMLYMLLSLSLGWTLGSSHKSSHLDIIRKKPAAKVVGVLAVIQGFLFLWEQYQDREHRLYHAHRSHAGAALVVLRILLASLFAWNLYTTVAKQRSALKKDFYSSFTKSCMLWFLCYPVFVIFSWIFSEYLRYKLVTMGVVLCQSAAVIMLYRLFFSRSLYWEVSALSSTLPLRLDKSFSLKSYS